MIKRYAEHWDGVEGVAVGSSSLSTARPVGWPARAVVALVSARSNKRSNRAQHPSFL